MAVRTALLNWNNIARDTDFSKYIETVSEPGVIEWLTVTSTKVAIWKARVPCLRTNGETIFALVSVTSEVTISGNGDVYIEVSQTYIDDWELANEDWTGIATIKVGTMPSKNALKLATINNGVVTDARNMIAKVWELKTYIQSLNSRMNTAEQKIDQIIEDKAVDHLEETGLVWEKYTLSNTLFKQATPTLANSTIDCNVGDVDANKQIHVQRITSKTASNSIKLKVKKVWAPTTWLVVEVRNATKVDVSNTEAYWYGGGSLICSGSIAYTAISTDYQEITVPLNGTFGGVQGQLVDVVVYQTGNIVNSTNYYVLACDSTQYSEAFSYVSVNGDTRTRSKLMPYCLSDWFAQYLLDKVKQEDLVLGSKAQIWTASGSVSKPSSAPRWKDDKIWEFDINSGGVLEIVRAGTFTTTSNIYDQPIYVSVDGETVRQKDSGGVSGNYSGTNTVNLPWGAHHVEVHITWHGNNSTSNGYWINCSFTLSLTPEIFGKTKGGAVPTKIEEIGAQTVLNIFWIFDGEFFVWIETENATTWSITPWNFVGYLQIWDYKIPYYK